jgi:hypothetical protein
VAENLCLRQQLLVLHRRQLRSRLSDRDRRFWILASRWFPGWQDILVVVSAATVPAQHGFGLHNEHRGSPANEPPTCQNPESPVRILKGTPAGCVR